MRYTLLGRSGLRVSEVALGTMTFGEAWGWGASKDESHRIFDAYVEVGGNFVDTACNYTDGQSEEIVGELVASDRDHFVVATKYTLTSRPADPNAGGNHRKNLVHTLEASLRRLRTDYVDLLWLHMWDGLTPVEEVVRALDDLVSSGKVLYVGISDTPAWVVSRAVTLAEQRGWAPFVAVQAPYSLLDRDVERELLPMASSLGMTLTPWGTLEGGALTGKYLAETATDEPRRYDGVGPRANAIAREAIAIAEELDATARAGRDRLGSCAALAHRPDRRGALRGTVAREPRRARHRARRRAPSPSVDRRASSVQGSLGSSSSRTTSAGSSSARRST
jgi:aryl-alcohol dehydrogenase-like predicted oxidoreductase